MDEYRIYVNGKLEFTSFNVNHHQIALDKFHARGLDPVEERIKHRDS